MPRVFSAIEIENKELRKELSYVRDTINLGFNTVSQHKMHITLEFFEDLNPEQIEKYKQKLQATQIGSFHTTVKGIGSFPSEDHIRVIWAGIKEEKQIRKLYKIISQHELPSSNKHKFKPHITLLRINKPSKEQQKLLKNNIREFNDYQFGKLHVNKIKLYETQITPKGSKYKTLETFKL